MNSIYNVLTKTADLFRNARIGLQLWTRRQWLIAAASTVGYALLLGLPTVLIPNDIFARDIDTLWWNYPVWILTSIFAGMLTASYVRPKAEANAAEIENDSTAETRSAKLGTVGGVLAFFAVGCPVCNKLALIALGYTGAMTYFAPIQPFFAVGALLLTAIALLYRLRGQVYCPIKPVPTPA